MEVAKDGKVTIPSSVFESAPAPAPAAAAGPSSSNGKVTQVRRLDGSVEEVVTGLPPNNPNFAPRQAWAGGKIVTNDKLEVLLKFYERKGKPLTPELAAKKAELEAAGNAEAELKAKRAAKFGGGAMKARLGGGSSSDAAAPAAATKAKAKAAAAALPEAPKVSAETSSWYKNRPKGGVKVLGGNEGAVGAKRPREGEEAAE